VDKATYAVTPSIFCVQPITVGPPVGCCRCGFFDWKTSRNPVNPRSG
jgi:hypothetical protein